jgi:predicted glycosyltransferase
MRRVSSIARRLLRTCPDARVLTLGDSPLGNVFGLSANQDYVQLPSVARDAAGTWRPLNTTEPFERVQAERTQLIHDAVLPFRPDVVLVDHLPVGMGGELLPTLEALRSSYPATRIVLGLRDIVDAAARVREKWREQGEYDAIERLYDRVLVYGRGDVFDVAREYALSPTIISRLRYCGYVCAADMPQSWDRHRSTRLAGTVPGTKLIAVMAGGGADSYPLMRACLDALPVIQAHQASVMHLHPGPFLPGELRRALHREATSVVGASVSEDVSDTLSSLHAADLVVAMCGYNTTMEVLRSGRPSILIPRTGPSAEQRTRAELFAARGWVQTLDPREMGAGALAGLAIASLQEAPARQSPLPDLDGLDTVVEDLLSAVTRGASAPDARCT